MNVSPLLYFAIRHGSQIAGLFSSGNPQDAQKFLELAKAVTPWLKKYYPWLNDNNLLDDAIGAVNEAFNVTAAPTHWPGYPDPTQQ